MCKSGGQHHKHKLLISFISSKLYLIVCIIISTVYIIVYEEKKIFLYVLFISISFLISALEYSACWK